MIAFGGETIDSQGVIRDFPALSMVTGLIASALGWDRGDGNRLNRLQERIRMGAALEPGSRRLNDFQTAKLAADDTGWTTWGSAEGRAGNVAGGTYDAHHLRLRDYHVNLRAWIVLHLLPAEEAPELDDVAAALDRPMRPLFVGRKSCVPTGRLVAGWSDAVDVLDALRSLVGQRGSGGTSGWKIQWPAGQGSLAQSRRLSVCDERNWNSGVHGGWRPVHEALLLPGEARS